MQNRWTQGCLVLSLVSGTWMVGAVAEAQSTGELRADTRVPNSRIALDVGFYTHQQTIFGAANAGATIVVPSLEANVNVATLSEDMSLSVDVAFRSVISNTWLPVGDDDLNFRAGNLYMGARLALTPVEGLRIRFGAGVVAPIMNAYDNNDVAPATVLASTLPNGAWDSWMTWRGDVPFVLRADGEYRSDIFFVGAETALALGVPVLEGYDEVSVGAQFGVWGGVRPIPQLALGARLQAVLVDPGERDPGTLDPRVNDAIGFASLTPFVRGEFGSAFVETRFFLSLADNRRYDFIGEKSWGLYFLGGLNF